MIRFFLLINRQGVVRLKKFWAPFENKAIARLVRDVQKTVLTRSSRVCNFVDWQEHTLVYRRYAALCAVFCVDKGENELLTLELIHQFIQILDVYFGNVCELDLIFNFPKVYLLLDEFIIAGEMQETSITRVADAMEKADTEESAGTGDSTIGTIMKALNLADQDLDREQAARRAGITPASTKTEFHVKYTVDKRSRTVELAIKRDCVQFKNIHTQAVEREWSYTKVKSWDHAEDSFTFHIFIGSSGVGDEATSKVTVETPEGAAITASLSNAHKKYHASHK
jgi:AP-1 complex subunit sigma 1/2